MLLCLVSLPQLRNNTKNQSVTFILSATDKALIFICFILIYVYMIMLLQVYM